MTKIAQFNMVAHLLRTMSNTEMLLSHLKALGLLVGVPRHPLPLQQQLCSALQRLPTLTVPYCQLCHDPSCISNSTQPAQT